MRYANDTEQRSNKADWSFRVAGVLWGGSGLYWTIYFVAAMVRDGHLTPLRLLAPGGCALIAVCGTGLYRRRKWAKRLASALVPVLILAMLDLLLMIAFKHSFGTSFYVVCAMLLLGLYVAIILLIDNTQDG